MAHVYDLLRLQASPAFKRAVQTQITTRLQRMGKLILPAEMADRAYIAQSTEILLSKAEKNTPFTPVEVRYFVLNRPFHLATAPLKNPARSDQFRSLGDASLRLQRELAAEGCYTGLVNHMIYNKPRASKTGSEVLSEQIYLFVPDERPVMRGHVLTTEPNMDQIDLFVFMMASRGLLNLKRDRQSITDSFGLRSYMQATLRLQDPDKSPSTLDV